MSDQPTRKVKTRTGAGGKVKAEALPARLTLAETQSLFQQAILTGDERVLEMLLDNSMTTKDTLFSVYKNGYSGRLAEILANDYEVLHTYLGDDLFHEVAHAYIAAHPSKSQNARWFGAKLPEFLATDARYRERVEFADMALLEKALADAFDAADDAALSIADLGQYPADAWGRLTFAPHPSATMLMLRCDVLALWTAMKDGSEEAPPLDEGTVQRLIVWRHAGVPMVRMMGDEEAMMWTEAGAGKPFEALCEMVATFNDPTDAAVRAAGYLQGWLQTDMLAGAVLRPLKAVRQNKRREMALKQR